MKERIKQQSTIYEYMRCQSHKPNGFAITNNYERLDPEVTSVKRKTNYMCILPGVTTCTTSVSVMHFTMCNEIHNCQKWLNNGFIFCLETKIPSESYIISRHTFKNVLYFFLAYFIIDISVHAYHQTTLKLSIDLQTKAKQGPISPTFLSDK